MFESIYDIVAHVDHLEWLAAQQYKPVVDDFLRSGCRDAKQIAHTLPPALAFPPAPRQENPFAGSTP